MSDSYREQTGKGPFIKKRKMLPFAYTDDGHSPIKANSGMSGESVGFEMSFKQMKSLRKKNRRLNQVENKRARKHHKDQTRREYESELV